MYQMLRFNMTPLQCAELWTMTVLYVINYNYMYWNLYLLNTHSRTNLWG